MTTVCAFAILIDEGSRVLLCHRRKDGKWNLPGGEVKPGEAPWVAVAREVREELGTEMQILRVAGIYFVAEKDDLVLTFLGRLPTTTLQPSAEIDAIDWFDCDGMPSPMRERHAERVVDALRRGDVIVREH